MKPGYLELHQNGKLDHRAAELFAILESCVLCPRACRKNRRENEKGYCQSGEELIVSAIHPHLGEEEPLVGRGRFFGVGGSGTVFLTGCNLGCVYCQNYDISHLIQGTRISADDLARSMIELQNNGCHNVNFVTPTHFVPQLVKSIEIAAGMGLNIPIVYNCGGYESVETIRLLEGIIDIYMPDIKYSDSQCSAKYSNAPDYFERCKEAVKEMHRQVGDLRLNSRDIAERGLLIRHLVLPNDLAGSRGVLKFIAEEISTDSYVNLMAQYLPLFEAANYEELNRRPSQEEYRLAIEMAGNYGLHRGFAV